MACWPLRVGKGRGVVGVALGHDLHLRWGDVYYGDGGSHKAQGVHLACRVSVDVGVRGHEWPLLIAVVVRQDGVRVVLSSCSWAQMPVPTDVGTLCCASIHRGQVLRAICASFMRMAATSRTSG